MKPVFVTPWIVLPMIMIATPAGCNRSADEPAVVRASGNIEVTQVQSAFRVSGYVTTRPVDEGRRIETGTLIARLDPTELTQDVERCRGALQTAEATLAELLAGSRVEEIAAAQAAVARAEAFLAELLAGSRPQDIAVGAAAVDRCRAQVEFFEADFRRMSETVESKAVTRAQYDNSRMLLDAAKARLAEAQERLKLLKEGPRREEIAQARAALDEAKQKYTLLKNGPRKETIDQARGQVTQAKNALAIAQTRLSYATLTSPMSAVVLSKNIEPGEFVAAGTPIVTLANLDSVWLRVYVHETDLGRVKLGQSANVTTDTFPGKIYPGQVTFIASEAEFTPKSVQTTKERVTLVYRVKIDLKNPNHELKAGMPADAEIVLSNK